MHISYQAGVIEPAVVPKRAWPWRRIFFRVAVVCVLLDVAIFATLYGLRVRKAQFVDTYGVHFKGDVRNGFRWGMEAEGDGLFNLYDRIAIDVAGGRRTMDYAPLRLTAVYLWVQWAHQHYPGETEWEDDYAFTKPMLDGNTTAEFISSVLVFLIVRLWCKRADEARRPPGARPRMFRGVIVGLIGAMLFWFNPAIIRDGHSWPQWDVWLVPFYLGAVLLASVNWWFTAGMLLMIGAAFKGQILIAAPVLILWPLFSLRLDAVLKLICGFGFAAAVILWLWIKPDHDAIVWMVRMTVAIAALLPWVLWRGERRETRDEREDSDIARTSLLSSLLSRLYLLLPGLLVSWAVLAWQWKALASWTDRLLPLAVLVPVALSRWLPRRLLPSVFAAALAGVVFLSIPICNTDSNWFTVGFKYGTEKFGDMITGSGTWNLAKMQQVYQIQGVSFSQPSDLVSQQITLPKYFEDLTYRNAALIVYGVCLAICGIGAAMHARRRKPSTRFLVAMVAPWVCMYMILPQMHGRYLMWGAGCSALLIGESAGLAVLGVLLSIVSCLNIMQNQYIFERFYDPQGLQTLQSLDPHVGWMVLLIMGILLWISVYPERRLYSAGVKGSSVARG